MPSNIAERKGHHSDRDFVRFLLHARGSLLELQTQLLIAKELHYVSSADEIRLTSAADAVGKALNALINSMSKAAA